MAMSHDRINRLLSKLPIELPAPLAAELARYDVAQFASENRVQVKRPDLSGLTEGNAEALFTEYTDAIVRGEAGAKAAEAFMQAAEVRVRVAYRDARPALYSATLDALRPHIQVIHRTAATVPAGLLARPDQFAKHTPGEIKAYKEFVAAVDAAGPLVDALDKEFADNPHGWGLNYDGRQATRRVYASVVGLARVADTTDLDHPTALGLFDDPDRGLSWNPVAVKRLADAGVVFATPDHDVVLAEVDRIHNDVNNWIRTREGKWLPRGTGRAADLDGLPIRARRG